MLRQFFATKKWCAALLCLLSLCLFSLSSSGSSQNIVSDFRYPLMNSGGTEPYGVPNFLLPNNLTCRGELWSRENHAGIDIYANPGDPVFAVADGEVVTLHEGSYPGGGIIIKHTLPDGSNIYSVYGHLAQGIANFEHKTGSYFVSYGFIEKNKVIGSVLDQGGNTHLHFEIRTMQEPDEPSNCSKLGSGYTSHNVHPDSVGYLNPTEFIDNFNYYTRLQDRAFVFTGSFFRGDVFGYLTPGFRSLAGLFINNAASSLSLPSGWGATVYDGEAGGGAQKFFGLSDWDFRNDGYTFNNQSISVDNTVSAIRISANNCSGLGVAAAGTFATLSCDPKCTHSLQSTKAPPKMKQFASFLNTLPNDIITDLS